MLYPSPKWERLKASFANGTFLYQLPDFTQTANEAVLLGGTPPILRILFRA